MNKYPAILKGSFPVFPTPNEQDRVLVLGLGNVLFSDEGVGVHTVAVLRQRCAFLPAIDIVDGGTMGLDLLPFFQDRSRILLIDAVDFRKAPGQVGMLSKDDIRAVLNPKLSTHHIGVADLLFTAAFTRESTLDLCLIGVQPQNLQLGLNLSPIISGRQDHLIQMTLRKLKQWGIHISSIQPDLD